MQGRLNFDTPIQANSQTSYLEKFESDSPINTDRMTGQNKRLYDYLMQGKKIHCFHPAMKTLRIGYLNSRIANLVKKKVPINKERIETKDTAGNDVDVVEYSILQTKPSNN